MHSIVVVVVVWVVIVRSGILYVPPPILSVQTSVGRPRVTSVTVSNRDRGTRT